MKQLQEAKMFLKALFYALGVVFLSEKAGFGRELQGCLFFLFFCAELAEQTYYREKVQKKLKEKEDF